MNGSPGGAAYINFHKRSLNNFSYSKSLNNRIFFCFLGLINLEFSIKGMGLLTLHES